MVWYIGIDCGSGSVRAVLMQIAPDGLIDAQHVYRHEIPIEIHNPKPDFYMQSTDEIWSKACECVKAVVKEAKVTGDDVRGIGVTATCSLTIIDSADWPDKHNVIMWMDHRALSIAQEVTAHGSKVLDQMGNVCHPEFSISKMIWLRRNEAKRFEKARGFMELPDYLTWKACDEPDIGDFSRSMCSLVCKWGYDAENDRWREDFMNHFGFQDLMKDSGRIGRKSTMPGTKVGTLGPEAAKMMGLVPKNPTHKIYVGASLIDAHAGVLSMLTLHANSDKTLNNSISEEAERVFCMIAGTSTCNMVSIKQKKVIQGMWGPYYSAIFPGLYTFEPGQSATGKLIDHVIRTHPDYRDRFKGHKFSDVCKVLNEEVEKRGIGNNPLHCISSYHGNRSPLARPDLRGGLYGETLSEPTFADVYEAAIEGIAYDTKLIIDALEIPNLKAVLLTGGQLKNPVLCQIHADIFGCPFYTIKIGQTDMVLIGAAFLGFLGANNLDTDVKNLTTLRAPGIEVVEYQPNKDLAEYHRRKYVAHHELLLTAKKVEDIMNNNAPNGTSLAANGL